MKEAGEIDKPRKGEREWNLEATAKMALESGSPLEGEATRRRGRTREGEQSELGEDVGLGGRRNRLRGRGRAKEEAVRDQPL